jgi:hypothetical protein
MIVENTVRKKAQSRLFLLEGSDGYRAGPHGPARQLSGPSGRQFTGRLIEILVDQDASSRVGIFDCRRFEFGGRFLEPVRIVSIDRKRPAPATPERMNLDDDLSPFVLFFHKASLSTFSCGYRNEE